MPRLQSTNNQLTKVPGWMALLMGMLVGSLMFLGIETINQGGFSAQDSLSILAETTPRRLSVLPTSPLSGSSTAKTANSALNKAILNNPGGHLTHGNLQKATNFSNFTNLKPFNRQTDEGIRSEGNEAFSAVTRYFWGSEFGSVLELGALDGKAFSVSADFLPFHWHRVLIEGSPKFAKRGTETSPDSTYIHTTICQREHEPNRHLRNGQMQPTQKTYHYVQDLDEDAGHDGSANGIGEFMTRPFLERYHNYIFHATSEGTDFEALSDWSVWNQVQEKKGIKVRIDEVPCLNLASIFLHLNIQHINFFVLDVVGAELNVLQGIDWDAIRFDVLVVATEPFDDNKFRPKRYSERVRDFLLERGYIFERNEGRNSWFRHPTFVVSQKPDADLAARNRLKKCVFDEDQRKIIACRNS